METGSFMTRKAFHTAPTMHIQIHTWKMIPGLKPVQAFNGSYVGSAVCTSSNEFTILINKNVSNYVPLTCKFLVGRIKFTNDCK